MKKLYYDVKKCTGCKTCELVCAVGHSPSKDLYTAILQENFALPSVRVHFVAEANYGFGCRESQTIALPAYGFGCRESQTIALPAYPLACRHCKEHPCVSACIASALSYTSEKGLSFDQEKCVGCWMCVMVCPYGAVRPDKRNAKSVRCDLCADINDPRCAKSCPTKAILYIEEKTDKK